MKLIEGIVAIGIDHPPDGATAFTDVDAFVERLQEIGAEHGCAIQAFDARYIAGRAHLESAVAHANRSMARGENVATDRAVEILCYAAGTRQIDEALTIGVRAGRTKTVVVVDAGSLGVPPDVAPLEHSGDEDAAAAAVEALLAPEETIDAGEEGAITDAFDIGPDERSVTTASLELLVRERVALLDVQK